MRLDKLLHNGRHGLRIVDELLILVFHDFIMEGLSHTDGMPPVLITGNENRKYRSFEFFRKTRRPLREGKNPVHEADRNARPAAILIGQKPKDVIFLHGPRRRDHLIAARAGEINVLPGLGAVFIDDLHQCIIGLLFPDG